MTSTPTHSAPDPIVDATEMVFTDADLENIERELSGLENSPSSMPLGEMAVAVGYTEMRALLKRLEEAEKALEGFIAEYDNADLSEVNNVGAWRKAAGK